MIGAQQPYFGRRYSVTVTGPQGTTFTLSDSTLEPKALRVTFDIQQRAFQAPFWFGDVTVYNLGQTATNALLGGGRTPPQDSDSLNVGLTDFANTLLNTQVQNYTVTVQAGYLNGAYGTVWVGDVLQPIFERQNAVDFKLTLRCMVGLLPIVRNGISKTFVAGIEQLTMVRQIADQCFSKIPVQSVSSHVSTKTLPRAKTVFGNPGDAFTAIAEDNNMQWWMSNKGLSMAYLNDDDIASTPAVTFVPPVLPRQNAAGAPPTPVAGAQGVIVGTPQQTQYGVSFRALLNPNVQVNRPLQLIKIDNTLIRQYKISIGAPVTVLDQDGEYVVLGTRFIGDTRGNDWYVDVDCATRALAKVQLLQYLQALGNG